MAVLLLRANNVRFLIVNQHERMGIVEYLADVLELLSELGEKGGEFGREVDLGCHGGTSRLDD